MNIQLIVAAIMFLGSTSALAQSMGQPGYDGRDGQDGRNGTPGIDRTIIADGNAQTVDVSGRDGTSGSRGDYGGDATGCYQSGSEPHNLIGADGGDGGRGGHGGDGGQSGNLTVYFDNIQNLHALYINAAGGRGGAYGYGGRGGYGCYCSRSSWQVNGVTYYCSSGRQGMDGSRGDNGSAGASGRAYLVPQLAPLPNTTPQLQTTFAILAEFPQTISKKIWQTRSGARSLFRNGSILADSYMYFDRIISQTFAIAWEDDRAIQDFAPFKVSLSFNEDQPRFTIDPEAWLIADLADQDGVRQIHVRDAMLAREAKAMRLASISGRDRNLTASLQDNSGQLTNLETKYYLEYYVRGAVIWYKRFEGWISPEHITTDGNKISVRVGALPIDLDFLRSGRNVEMVFKIRRTFGENQLTVTQAMRHRID